MNALQPTLAGGQDAFVAKLSADGSALVYSTYLGGSDDELGLALDVDATGSVYLTGYTQSTDFPVVDPIQAHWSGDLDVFVAKLTDTGQQLDYSTYLGGPGQDLGNAIVVDAAGTAFVTGGASAGFPTTENALQPVSGGNVDVFVVKIAPNASQQR